MTLKIKGRKYGQILAVRPTKKRFHGNVVWHCVCDCGRTRLVPGTWLGRWVQSCGKPGCSLRGAHNEPSARSKTVYRLLKKGESPTELARKFGVTRARIYQIRDAMRLKEEVSV